MELRIFKKPLMSIGSKEKQVALTNEEDVDRELDTILEEMEEDGYIQCEASEEEMSQWDAEYKDWILVCDSEDDSDRVLIFVK